MYKFSYVVLATLLHFNVSYGQDSNFTTKSNLADSIVSTSFTCAPSIPLEIAAASIVWGLPAYFIVRPIFHHGNEKGFYGGIFLPISYFLLMYSLGPIAEWTSGCDASYWHIMWIGLTTHLAAILTYGAIQGSDNEPRYKFDLGEYALLSILPAAATTLIYNTFLEPSDKDKGMMILPSVNSPNMASLNFIVKF